MVDLSLVTAVTAASAQSAAAPVTIDAMFGALLQSITDAEPTAIAAPLIQSAALAMILPADNSTGQQDNTTVTPGQQAPGLFASIASTAAVATPDPLPDVAQQGIAAINSPGSAEIPLNAAWPAFPQIGAAPVQTGATADNNVPSLPTAAAVPAPQLASAVQPPTPQQVTPSTQQVPQSEQQTSAELPQSAAPSPEPVPVQARVPVQAQAQVKTNVSQTAEQAPTPLSNALDVANQTATPAPLDPTPVTAKPAASKTKTAVEQPTDAAKHDDTTNTMVDVLAGFLLPQIVPIAAPANDTTADTVDPAASAKNDDQSAPAVAATDQNSATPVQPVPVAMVQPPMVPAAAPPQTDGPIALAAVGQTPKDDAPATPIVAQDNTTPVAQKPAMRQQAARQTTTEHRDSQPVFVPANDTTPDGKPEIQPLAAAETRTPSTTDAPQPAQTSATTPAPHQAPAAIANAAIPMVASSGLRKLTAGLQVAAQEQETTASLDKLGLTIATKSIDGLRHFDIRLDPPELGRVQVQLTTDDTGRTQANVVVDKPQTLDLLQRDAQNLNRALNDAGLDVSNNGLNFSLREQSRQNDGGEDQGRGRSLSVQAVMLTDATHIHSSLGSYAPNSVRLDIRV